MEKLTIELATKKIKNKNNNELTNVALVVLHNIFGQNCYARAYQTVAESMSSFSVGEELLFVNNVPIDKRVSKKTNAEEITGAFWSVDEAAPDHRHDLAY